MSVLLAGLSALCYGAADFTGGRATRRSSVFSVLLLSQFTGLVGVLAAAALIPDTTVGVADLLWGAAAGAAGVIGLSILYTALATTIAAIASPAAALVGAVAPVIVGALTGESPGLTGWLGIALAVPAVLLLTIEKRFGENPRRALLLGVFAGLGFGCFFVFIAQTGPESGLWPLAASKVCSIIMALIVILVRGTRVRVSPPSRVPAISAGLLDMAANVLFLMASRVGLLAISGVVSSLYPGPTVLLARAVEKQRLPVPRIIGLILALGGVSLMTL